MNLDTWEVIESQPFTYCFSFVACILFEMKLLRKKVTNSMSTYDTQLQITYFSKFQFHRFSMFIYRKSYWVWFFTGSKYAKKRTQTAQKQSNYLTWTNYKEHMLMRMFISTKNAILAFHFFSVVKALLTDTVEGEKLLTKIFDRYCLFWHFFKRRERLLVGGS